MSNKEKENLDKIRYIIRYNYDTGDSFHTERGLERDLDVWYDVLIAEKNLKRIREHHEYYQAMNHHYPWDTEGKAKAKKTIEEAKKCPWFVEKFEWSLKLLDDSGKEYQISAPWCGYFEHLNHVEIIEDNPNRKYKVK
jgi:hypothetical protein